LIVEYFVLMTTSPGSSSSTVISTKRLATPLFSWNENAGVGLESLQKVSLDGFARKGEGPGPGGALAWRGALWSVCNSASHRGAGEFWVFCLAQSASGHLGRDQHDPMIVQDVDQPVAPGHVPIVGVIRGTEDSSTTAKRSATSGIALRARRRTAPRVEPDGAAAWRLATSVRLDVEADRRPAIAHGSNAAASAASASGRAASGGLTCSSTRSR
jgi:hypothetical protein